MGKSIEFVKERIKNGYCSDFTIDELNNVYEINFIDILKSVFSDLKEDLHNNKITLMVDGTDINGRYGKRDVSITYNPDANFEYFTTECCVCDGTLYFQAELINKVLRKVLSSSTYNNRKSNYNDDYPFDYDIEYEVGNFVINTEYGDFGTEEKPWLHARFTVMLPLTFNAVKKEKEWEKE